MVICVFSEEKGINQIMKDYTKNKRPDMLEPFFPNEMFRYIIVGCFLVVLDLLAVLFFPLPFNPANKPEHIPWFLIPVYLLKKCIHSELVFILMLVASALFFIFLPFIFRGKRRHDTKQS